MCYREFNKLYNRADSISCTIGPIQSIQIKKKAFARTKRTNGRCSWRETIMPIHKNDNNQLLKSCARNLYSVGDEIRIDIDKVEYRVVDITTAGLGVHFWVEEILTV